MQSTATKSFFESIVNFLSINQEDPETIKTINLQLRHVLEKLRNRENEIANQPKQQLEKLQPMENHDTEYFKQGPGYNKLCEKLGGEPSKVDMLKIAKAIIMEDTSLKKSFSRQVNRSKKLLIKWFNDYFDQISPLLGRMHFFTEDGIPLDCQNQ